MRGVLVVRRWLPQAREVDAGTLDLVVTAIPPRSARVSAPQPDAVLTLDWT
jgi:hypothetical protein